MFHTRAVHTVAEGVASSSRSAPYADCTKGASGVGAVFVRATRPVPEPGRKPAKAVKPRVPPEWWSSAPPGRRRRFQIRQSRDPVRGTLSRGRCTSVSAVRRATGGGFRVQERGQDAQQVPGAGPYGAGRGQPGHQQGGARAVVPMTGGLGAVGVAVRVGEAERAGGALGQQRRVVTPGAPGGPGEHVAEQAPAEVGVQDPGAGPVPQPGAAQRDQEVVLGETGVRVAEPCAAHGPAEQSRGQPGQAGGVGPVTCMDHMGRTAAGRVRDGTGARGGTCSRPAGGGNCLRARSSS